MFLVSAVCHRDVAYKSPVLSSVQSNTPAAVYNQVQLVDCVPLKVAAKRRRLPHARHTRVPVF